MLPLDQLRCPVLVHPRLAETKKSTTISHFVSCSNTNCVSFNLFYRLRYRCQRSGNQFANNSVYREFNISFAWTRHSSIRNAATSLETVCGMQVPAAISSSCHRASMCAINSRRPTNHGRSVYYPGLGWSETFAFGISRFGTRFSPCGRFHRVRDLPRSGRVGKRPPIDRGH